MKRMALVFIITLLTMACFAQAANTLVSGPMLSVFSAESYEVYVNGTLRGSTPLLLWNLPPGRNVLELRSASEKLRQTVMVDGTLSGMTTWVPVFQGLTTHFLIEESPPAPDPVGTGTIVINLKDEKSIIKINGEVIAQAGKNTTVERQSGLYLVEASRPGFLDTSFLVSLVSGQSVSIDILSSRSPGAMEKSNRTIGFSMLAGGLAVGIAGTVGGLNSILVPLSAKDYELYKTLKLSSLVGLGAGAVIAITGGIISLQVSK